MSRSSRPFLAAIAGSLLAMPSVLEAQSISFDRESLLITLQANSFSFSGLYYFDNPGPEPLVRPVHFPFVSSGAAPESTSILEVRTGKNIPIAAGKSGLSFIIRMDPFSTQSYRISFVQSAPHDSLEYILKTTAGWGEPLDWMTIRIQAPPAISVKSISLNPDSVMHAQTGTAYLIDHRNITPDRNLIVKWGRITP